MTDRTSQLGYVEDCVTLDVRELKRRGVIQVGERGVHAISWDSARLGRPEALLRVDCRDINVAGTIKLEAIVDEQLIEQTIELEFVAMPIAGHRAFFHCPFEGYRCELLYLHDGTFASRQAHGLNYLSQGLTDLSRARRRVAKLHSRLHGNGLLPRPRGNHRIDIALKLSRAREEERELFIGKLRRQAG